METDISLLEAGGVCDPRQGHLGLLGQGHMVVSVDVIGCVYLRNTKSEHRTLCL